MAARARELTKEAGATRRLSVRPTVAPAPGMERRQAYLLVLELELAGEHLLLTRKTEPSITVLVAPPSGPQSLRWPAPRAKRLS